MVPITERNGQGLQQQIAAMPDLCMVDVCMADMTCYADVDGIEFLQEKGKVAENPLIHSELGNQADDLRVRQA
eukprot:1149926-Pelagomonas_calceolata.AAC.4